MNLILITPEELDATGRARLTDARAKHIRNVLRAEPGKQLRVGLLNGPFGTGTVEEISEGSVMLTCEFEAETPPRPTIDLLLAMPRPKVLKRLWSQFAALGVGRIFVTNAEKVERYYFDTHILEPDFYNARFIEGLQQARDTRLPEVTPVKNLKPFLEDELFPNIEKKILADPSGTQNIFQTLEKSDEKVPRSGKILLAVGPEGGWTPVEMEMFKAHGFEVFGMGPRILRTDTACIALLGMISESQRRRS
jgi:RsmE family RNA methyltransferase